MKSKFVVGQDIYIREGYTINKYRLRSMITETNDTGDHIEKMTYFDKDGMVKFIQYNEHIIFANKKECEKFLSREFRDSVAQAKDNYNSYTKYLNKL